MAVVERQQTGIHEFYEFYRINNGGILNLVIAFGIPLGAYSVLVITYFNNNITE